MRSGMSLWFTVLAALKLPMERRRSRQQLMRGFVAPQKSHFTPSRRQTHGSLNDVSASNASASRRTPSKSIPTMDKNSMLVMEANEIVQCLQKNYVSTTFNYLSIWEALCIYAFVYIARLLQKKAWSGSNFIKKEMFSAINYYVPL